MELGNYDKKEKLEKCGNNVIYRLSPDGTYEAVSYTHLRQARCPEGAGGAGNPAEQTEYPGDFVAMCRTSEHGDEGGG